MILHWLTAALVFFLFGLGWYMTDLPTTPVRGPYFALHKSIGITVFLLLLVRLVWRLSHRPPAMSAALPAWQRILAGSVHKLFYVFLVLQPLTGYLSSSFSGHKTKFFVIPLPYWGRHDPPLNLLFTERAARGRGDLARDQEGRPRHQPHGALGLSGSRSLSRAWRRLGPWPAFPAPVPARTAGRRRTGRRSRIPS